MLDKNQVAFRADRASIVRAILEAKPESVVNHKGECLCPFHEDRRPSASIYQSECGAWKLKCKTADCGFHGDVFDIQQRAYGKKLGDILTECRDLPITIGVPPKPYVKPVRRYDRDQIDRFPNVKSVYEYHNPDGKIHGLVIRSESNGGKRFIQARPDGESYILKGPSAPHPLYRAGSIEAASTVLVVEGESCVERGIEGYADPSVAFTTSMGGAGKAALCDWSPLAGKRVWLWPDNDAPGAIKGISPGIAHMESVCDILLNLTPPATVYWIDPTELNLPIKGDLVDYCDDQPDDHAAIAGVMAGATLVVDALTLNEAPVADAVVNEPMVEDEAVADDLTPVVVRKHAAPTFRELQVLHPKLRPPVIHGMLRIGESMNIVAPPKAGKSWLVLDLALSIASGRDWLGYKVEKGDVLVLDNELHPETSVNRVPKVADARGISLSEYADELCIENLRGKLTDINAMKPYFDAIKPSEYKVIILDALYRFQPTGMDENSNNGMTAMYNTIDRYADQLGCCFILIHHTTKGSQAGKAITDMGAGGQSQSRAADDHMALREHEEEGVMVFDGSVRSFPPVKPVCLRWNWPVWNVDDELDATNIKTSSRKSKPNKGWNTEKFVDNFLDNTGLTKAVIIKRVGDQLSKRQADEFMKIACANGSVIVLPKGKVTQPNLYKKT